MAARARRARSAADMTSRRHERTEPLMRRKTGGVHDTKMNLLVCGSSAFKTLVFVVAVLSTDESYHNVRQDYRTRLPTPSR